MTPINRPHTVLTPQRVIDAIVIGASAGGVEALSRLLPALPATQTVSVFIVQHVPRHRPSLLVDIFTPICALAVREAEDKEAVEPGCVYFAPPNYHVLIEQGPCIALSVDPPVHYARPSIDVLFESAADVYRSRLAGVVLTGGNDDGAEGLEHIRRTGGLSIVQDPSEAQTPLMPEAALKRGPADIVLPLDVIADLLAHLIGISCKPAWP